MVLGAIALLILAILVTPPVMYYRKVYETDVDADAEDALLSHVPGLSRRFSYKELPSVKILGSRCGTVDLEPCMQVYFKMTKVVAKQLESLRQGAKES
ncbi:hypothetical protein L7F22_020710 [Adiantum nelumboides]|nr:hypothetical protein [Adiantum nelumboides]